MPHTWSQFAKDVAAMANTRGGLIIYGVSDRPVAFKGIQPANVNSDQYAKWVRNLVQPYLAGLELYSLASDDGSQALFVVAIPASELAPHSVAFDHTKDQAKALYASVTPYHCRIPRRTRRPGRRLAHHRGTADPAYPSLRAPAQPRSREGDHR